MRNVTIAGNEGGRGGGFFEDGLHDDARATCSSPPTSRRRPRPANCAVAIGTDPLVSEGGNLSSDATCALSGTGDRRASTRCSARSLPTAARRTRTRSPRRAPPSTAGATPRAKPSTSAASRGPPTATATATARCDVGASSAGRSIEAAINGLDDNGNGLVDCLDFDLRRPPYVRRALRQLRRRRRRRRGRPRRRGLSARERRRAAPASAIRARGKLVVEVRRRAAEGRREGRRARAWRRSRPASRAVERACRRSPGDADCLAKAGAGCERRSRSSPSPPTRRGRASWSAAIR